ncbi:MAG: hypothetical protein LBK66_07815 [Spirochaetaceae bacterium]|nr:hypothetical protein [Spirochaetaceae bacterium]
MSVDGGIFTMKGSAISGNTAKNTSGRNGVGGGVDVDGTRPQKRTTTAGEATALDSTKNLVQGGGWE